MSGGVLAIVAHPDDESLIAGGVLAACSAAGVQTAVLCLTRGELGAMAPDAVAGPALGMLRERELRRAAVVLGVTHVECLAHPDGELSWVDATATAAEVGQRIAAHRPRAVVTFGESGLYHHPDHMAVNRLVVTALERLEEDGVQLPVLWQAEWPVGLMTDLVAAMRARRLPSDLWGLAPEAFASATPAELTDLDVRAFAEVKLRALRCHESQLPAGHLLAGLPADLAPDFLGHEYFLAPVEGSDWLAQAVASGADRGPTSRTRQRV
jgi:LmbE family N-acetylglucosaminyl deacetylase